MFEIGLPELSVGIGGIWPLDCRESVLAREAVYESAEGEDVLDFSRESNRELGDDASSGLAMRSPPRDWDKLKSPSIVNDGKRQRAVVTPTTQGSFGSMSLRRDNSLCSNEVSRPSSTSGTSCKWVGPKEYRGTSYELRNTRVRT